MEAVKSKAPKAQQAQKDDATNDPLKALASESGLGGLFGHQHHGLGLLPVRCLEQSSSFSGLKGMLTITVDERPP